MKADFCVLDIDYVVESERQAIVRVWGKDRDGRNIVALDRGFRPYFYVLPEKDADIKDLEKKVLGLKIEDRKPLKVEVLEKKVYGKRASVLKVTVENPTDVPKFRDLVKDWREVGEEYEYDITYYRRYIIDKGLIPMGWVSVEGREVDTDLQADTALEIESIKPLDEDKYSAFKVMAFDLETIHQDGEERIIMASLRERGFERVITYRKAGVKGMKLVKDEKALIEEFIKTVRERDPDILVTYNGDRFDFLRLDERSGKYKIMLKLGRDNIHVLFKRRGRISSAQMNGRVHVDLYDFVENILSDTMSSEVLSLNSVAREILGRGKDDMDVEEIEESWRGKGFKKLVEHCLRDSELTLELSRHLLKQIFELSRVSGQKLFDTSRMTYSQLVEGLLMREAFRIGEIIPNRPKFPEIQKRRGSKPYEGGYVYTPEQGIHDNIAVFDFKGLYPSITITHHVSPETLECQCCSEKPIGAKVDEKVDVLSAKRNKVPGEPYHFCLKHKGFIPNIIERLAELRSEINEKLTDVSPKSPKYRELDNRQYALKVLANASYGYYGYAGSRWYSKVCAKSITAWGRFYIQKVIKFAKSKGYHVIYGDTDSLFLKVKNKKEADRFLKEVSKRLPKTMELEFEGLYKSGIFVLAKTGVAAKKRYALIDQQGGITIRGFEKVRRDWSNIAKKTQEAVLMHILRDKSPEKAIDAVRRTIKRIERGVDFDDLVIYTQMTKPVEEYEAIGPHVAAAKKALAKGIPVKEGSVIAYIITKGSGSISDRAVPEDLAKNYDPEYYIHNQVIPAALRVLAGLGCTEEDILKKRPQASLDKYMGRSIKHRLRSGISKLGKKGK